VVEKVDRKHTSVVEDGDSERTPTYESVVFPYRKTGSMIAALMG
jgi:hypothetical protein